MTSEYETITNISLLERDLRHLLLELEEDSPSYFRVAKEAFEALHRTMVEALRGTANLEITGKRKDKQRRRWCRVGDGPWMVIERTPIEGCRRAWRYTAPSPEEPRDQPTRNPADEDLIGFFDLLAMVQTDYYMSRYTTNSTPIRLTDEEMLLLERLFLQVRNESEHFMPKTLYIPVMDLAEAAMLALDVATRVLFDSGAAPLVVDLSDIRSALDRARTLLKQRLNHDV